MSRDPWATYGHWFAEVLEDDHGQTITIRLIHTGEVKTVPRRHVYFPNVGSLRQGIDCIYIEQ